MNEKRLFYLNKKQRYIYDMAPRLLTLLAGRRFGKTDGVAAPYLARVVTNMPRGKSAIYCANFKQGLTRTIPGTVAAIERITGWINSVHFYVGCKAPKEANFPLPLVTPFSWEHAIHWYNGHVTLILSQDVKFSANSLSLDAILVDEARGFKKEKLDQELIPAMSGTPGMFENFPLKKAQWMMSDSPLFRSEMWLINRESMSTPEIASEIEDDIQLYIKASGLNYPKHVLQQLLSRIDENRRKCHLFMECDSLENAAVLGVEYFADMRRILPDRIYRISILGQRVKRQSDGFYPAYDPEKHTYMVNNAAEVDNMRIEIKPTPKNKLITTTNTWDFKKLQEHTCFLDLDIDPKQSLNIALDYNANINWIVTAQKKVHEGRNIMMVLSSMFEKAQGGDTDKVKDLRDVCEAWCNYYEPHRLRCKSVTYYYNQTAKQKKYANGDLDEKFYVTVSRVLRSRGWQVTEKDMGQTMFHDEKYHMFIKVFQDYRDPINQNQLYLFPYFNKENNEFLLAAIENTGKKLDAYHRVQKDKSDEKQADNEDNPSELRTDGTDALDDLIIGMSKHYQNGETFIPSLSFISLK